MSTRSRKRHTKRKHNTQAKRDNSANVSSTKTDDIPVLIDTNCIIFDNSPKTQKNRLLDIVIKASKQLQLGYDLSQLLTLMDNLLAISNYSSEKQNKTLQILLDLLANIDVYEDENELEALKKKLQAKFLTAELRKLIVDENKLGRCSIFSDFLGRGHFGILLKGRLKMPNGSKVDVVIKEKDDPYGGERITEEAKIMAQFNHKNILKILAYCNKSGPKFAVEYLPLGSLSNALQKYTFSDSKLVDILRDIAAGMKYISSKGYLHRTLKCGNILLDSNGGCKISEFGLCQYVGDTDGVYEDEEMDEDDTSISPETRNSCKFTTKTDVWAMGLLAWEMYYIAKYSEDNPLFSLNLGMKRVVITGRLFNCGYPLPLWRFFNELVLNKDPRIRPTFARIKKKLDDFKFEE